MIRTPLSAPGKVIVGLLSVALLIGLYTSISYRQHQKNPNDRTIPTWSQLAQGLTKVFLPNERTGDIWILDDAKATFGRLLGGMAIGVFGALVIGIGMGCYGVIESFFLPPLAFLAKIPPTAMMAIFFVVVGLGYEMFVAMIAFGVLPTLAQSIYRAARKEVPDELIFKSYTLGASQFEIIWNVITKHILPTLLEAVRLQIGPAMVYLIAAEMLVADEGFGYRIRLQQRLLDMRVVYVYIAFLGVAGYGIDSGLTWIRRRLCPWYVH